MGDRSGSPKLTSRSPLRWWDGAALGLAALGAFLIVAAPTTSALGTWAPVLWLVATALSLLHGLVYGALARAYPPLVGGLPAYAIRAWSPRGRRVASAAAIGYWFAWASVPVVFGRGLGKVAEEMAVLIGTPLSVPPWMFDRAIPLLLVAVFMAIQLMGLTVALRAARYLGLALLLATAMAGLALARDTADVGAGAAVLRQVVRPDPGGRDLLAWLYLMCWTTYATEAAAVIAPRYRDPARGPSRATTSASLVLGVSALMVSGGLLRAQVPNLTDPGLSWTARSRSPTWPQKASLPDG
jgi:amino acid transporter